MRYIVTINWVSEEIEVSAKNKEEAKEKARNMANMLPDMEYVECEVLK
jgi:hypothetical protein